MSQGERTLYEAAEAASLYAVHKINGSTMQRITFENKLQMVRAASGQYYLSTDHFYLRNSSGAFGSQAMKLVATKAYQDAFQALSGKASKLTKIKALLQDLKGLKRRDPSMHCVVFTNSNEAHKMLVDILKPHYKVCAFKVGSDSKARDKAVREFQKGLKGGGSATVFVVTMKAGAVGITLTAASRVYLMEPCLDPASELQAAGRIHRLGQTKDVLVKRFAFRDSIDERIIKLHGKVERGEIK